MRLNVKRLHPAAQIPTYGSAGAACFDIHAVIDPRSTIGDRTIAPGQWAAIHTGLAFEIPPGFVLKVYSRSGHGFKHGVSLVNGTGIIDPDFRGELLVGLRNDGTGDFVVSHGDRIAQAMIELAPHVEFVEVDSLTDTARGAGGFGSTGT